jgi:hypothetical protein
MAPNARQTRRRDRRRDVMRASYAGPCGHRPWRRTPVGPGHPACIVVML